MLRGSGPPSKRSTPPRVPSSPRPEIYGAHRPVVFPPFRSISSHRCPGRLDEATHCLGHDAGNISSALVLLMELVIVIGHASASALRDATGAVPGDRDPTQGAALAVTREQVAKTSDVHKRIIERTQLSKFG